jgi:uncharacterized membrane protein
MKDDVLGIATVLLICIGTFFIVLPTTEVSKDPWAMLMLGMVAMNIIKTAQEQLR